MWQEPAARRIALKGPILYFPGMCCRSSVVEHSLGKGEVDSSILSGSTRKSLKNQHLPLDHFPICPLFGCEQTGKVPQLLGRNLAGLFTVRFVGTANVPHEVVDCAPVGSRGGGRQRSYYSHTPALAASLFLVGA